MQLLDAPEGYLDFEIDEMKVYGSYHIAAEGNYEDEEEEEAEGVPNATNNLADCSLEKPRMYKYSCSRCMKSYKRKGHLMEHQRIFCGKEKDQRCPYCDFCTYKKSNLKKHVLRMHFDKFRKLYPRG